MGALTSNPKRAEEYANVNTTCSSSINPRALKKQKVSCYDGNLSRNGSSRLSRYPEAKKLKRDVHGPCGKKLELGCVGRRQCNGVDEVDGINGVDGNVLRRRYEVREASACGKIRGFEGVQNVEEKFKEKRVFRDFSVEEIVVVKDDGFDEVDGVGCMFSRRFEEKKACGYWAIQGLGSGEGVGEKGKEKVGSRNSGVEEVIVVEDGVDEDDEVGFMFRRRCEEKNASGSGAIQGFKSGECVAEMGKEKAVLRDNGVDEIVIVEDGREGFVVVSGDDVEKENLGLWETAKMAGREVVDQKGVPDTSVGVRHESTLECIGRMLSLGFSWFLNLGKVERDPPAYKNLLSIAARRDPKLKSLQAQINLREKQLHSLQSWQLVKKPEPEEDSLRESFVPLTREEEESVARAFRSNTKKALVIHEGSNIQITGEVIQCLRPGAWLNDEVINLYLELLKERERRDPKKFLKCHFFNTFFYQKLIGGGGGYDYKSVRRWTTQRKLGYDLLECEKIFVPIHQEAHWCLAIINKKDQKFQYLDSLGGRDTQVLRVLAKYYDDEVKDKNGEDIDVSSWSYDYVKDLPQQKNRSDCGVFMIKYTDFYSRGLGLLFSQDNMPYFRRRTAKEILQLRAD